MKNRYLSFFKGKNRFLSVVRLGKWTRIQSHNSRAVLDPTTLPDWALSLYAEWAGLATIGPARPLTKTLCFRLRRRVHATPAKQAGRAERGATGKRQPPRRVSRGLLALLPATCCGGSGKASGQRGGDHSGRRRGVNQQSV